MERCRAVARYRLERDQPQPHRSVVLQTSRPAQRAARKPVVDQHQAPR